MTNDSISNEWQEWYAWFPVYVETFFVWNQPVLRKRQDPHDLPQDCECGLPPKWLYKMKCRG